MLARLHAVSSRNMYSEHGFDPFILPASGQVCHSLMVVSNWTPGSAHAHAVYATLSQSSPASRVLQAPGSLPSALALSSSVLQWRSHLPPSLTESMNELGTLTELLLFCPETVRYASPCQSVSSTSKSTPFHPCFARSTILCMCGWGTLSLIAVTIAFRRDSFEF